jgi:tetratricopeptide (TPR) repeat protein
VLSPAVPPQHGKAHPKGCHPEECSLGINLGNALWALNRLADAEKAYRDAMLIDRARAEAYVGLGAVLMDMRRYPEAVAVCSQAVQLKKDPTAYYNMGNAHKALGQLSEAVSAYREAIKLSPEYAEAHCNLGNALRAQGKFADSLAEYRRGHELGRKRPGWRYPSARWVQDAEKLVALDDKLAAVLDGKVKPDGAAERFALAEFCVAHKRLPLTAARQYTETFADPQLSEDMKALHLYNAGCAASLAGTGQGLDAAKIDDQERARWRKQALDWLRAALAVSAQRVDKGTPAERAAVHQRLQHWQEDADLAGMRDEPGLLKLADEERDVWLRFWADVTALRLRAKSQAKELQPDKP